MKESKTVKTLILYNTVSGYTQRYAEMLKERLSEDAVTLMPLKQFKPKALDPFDRVVFMSRVTNDTISGFKTVVKHAELFAEKYACIVAVGMAKPTAAQYRVIENANIPYKLKGIPLFVVRGGFDAQKLKGGDKLIIKMTVSRLMKAQSRSPEEMAMLNFLNAKTDKVNSQNLQPVEQYLKSGIFQPPETADDDSAAEPWIDLEDYMPKSSVE